MVTALATADFFAGFFAGAGFLAVVRGGMAVTPQVVFRRLTLERYAAANSTLLRIPLRMYLMYICATVLETHYFRVRIFLNSNDFIPRIMA